ncbi:hypothetical protein HXX76_009801 [Chlamydomonas incerta]|uniref:Leucine-rich repeat-containing N-terminal plant-type domain-containing protein n=1 Tax=Chlamydomonas incerta TaxID=51695 RepID=A0A835VVG2_CHLIN|nr:hypothetical protein HXX76_009801 [Chlamydomonas incerta]|eukprot:KAG2430827.1 hypothetical protein HXX76_009801 [Chlamydomonas incerta]
MSSGLDCTDNSQVLGYPGPGVDCTPINATAALAGIDMPENDPAVQAAAVTLQGYRNGSLANAAALPSWGTGGNPCLWHGVLCNANLQVAALDIHGLSLSGPVPSGGLLTSFPALSRLDLSSNLYSGTIPAADLAYLTALTYLSLANNGLGGTLPAGLTALPNLRILDLSLNALTGSLPAVWFSGANKLGAGTVWRLSCRQCNLTGSLPAIDAGFTLQTFQVPNNQLAGSIPAFALTDNQELDYSNNALTSNVPDFGVTIKRLYLSGNQLTGNLPYLHNMQDVRLRGNAFIGPLWTALHSGAFLLDLAYNKLSGTLPSTWSLATNLSAVYLTSNNITGTLPMSWADMQLSARPAVGTSTLAFHLKVLYLDGNALAGTIPPEWASFSPWGPNAFGCLSLVGNARLCGSLPEGMVCLNTSGTAIGALRALCAVFGTKLTFGV